MSLSDVPDESGPAGRKRFTGVLLHGVFIFLIVSNCMLVSKITGDRLH